MGYQSTVQVIRRGGKNRQYYLICPAPLAQALEMEKGEVVEWVVEDKHTLPSNALPGSAQPPQPGGGPMPNESPSGQQEMWAGARPQSPTPAHPDPEEERRDPRLKRVNRNQLLLRTVDVEQLVEPEHRVRAIWELVGRLDLRQFHQAIEAVEGAAGRPAFDPQLLISLWIYAYR